MARPRSIDRNEILSAAEDLLTETGGLYFTLDQVASRVGISKGAVTNAYKSKVDLVGAMLDREFTRFRAERLAYLRADHPYAATVAHIVASERVSSTYALRAARLIAALTHEQCHVDKIRDLYTDLLEELSGDERMARQGRLALFAIEGAFLMRGLGIVTMTDEEWHRLFEDALAVFE